MNNKIPNDLKKYAIKMICIRTITCAIMLLSFVIILINSGDVVFSQDNQLYRIKEIFCIAIFLLIFYVCGIPFKLIDFTFFGTIENVTVRTGYSSEVNGARQSQINSRTVSNQKYRAVNNVTITIRTTNNKLITRKALTDIATGTTNYDDVFKKGDNIFHLYGTKHYVKLPSDKSQNIICPICGSHNMQMNSNCGHCKHSLVTKMTDNMSHRN